MALDRLHARRAQLEGGVDVGQARARLAEADADAGDIRSAIDILARDQQRLETDVESMDHKRRDEQKRLLDGSVANPKELQSIQAEVDSIANRTRRLEDKLLELMEERETLEGRLVPAKAAADAARAAFEELTKDSADELRDIERTIGERTSARAAIVPLIDEDLLELYEELRHSKKGVGVAALVDGICQGCHQKLSPMELDRIKRAPGIRRCDYCRRILVIA